MSASVIYIMEELYLIKSWTYGPRDQGFYRIFIR